MEMDLYVICELSKANIAEKILIVLDKRKGMKRKCIASAKWYDWDRIVDLAEEFYKIEISK